MSGSEISREQFIKFGLTVLAGGLTACAPDLMGKSSNLATSTPTQHRLDTDPFLPPYFVDPTVTPFDIDSPILNTVTSTPEIVTGTPKCTPTQRVTETVKPTEIPFDPDQKIPVLEYHNPSYGTEGGKSGDVYMTMEIFEKQMEIIKELGLKTPSEKDILDWSDKKRGLPSNSVILRVDIGVPYKDYEEEFKIFEKMGFSALTFIMTAYIPEKTDGKYVGWDFIKEYTDKKVLTPGSHGTYQPDYKTLTEREALWDALNSKKTIEDKIGRPVDLFAYPYDSEGHDEALLKHFKMLFGNFNKKGADAGDPLRIGTIYPYYINDRFDWTEFEDHLSEYSEK